MDITMIDSVTVQLLRKLFAPCSEFSIKSTVHDMDVISDTE